MKVVNIQQAKNELSQLLVRVQKGEKIIITNGSEPVAILSPYNQCQPSQRIPGRLRGQFIVPDNFNKTDEELINLFEED